MNKKVFPKLKFRFNKNLDKKVGFNFLNQKKAGIDFGAAIIKFHPQLAKAKNLPSKSKKLLISQYVDKYYQVHGKEMKPVLQKAEKQWQKIEKQFFLATNKIFNHSWPKGKYIAYLSIFNCNPRFLKTKTFQFFWQRPTGYSAIIAHEMLHFLFYDYLEKHFSKIESISASKIWALSEVANYFILNSPSFKKLLTQKSEPLYPNLQNLAGKLLPLWQNSESFDEFASSALKFLKT